MASSLFNRAKVNTATTGTGTMTLGAAVSNAFMTFAEAGVTDGLTVSYLIEDGLDFEIGTGVYTASGTTLSRVAVTMSKIAGTAGTTKITLSGAATVSIVARAEDLATLNSPISDTIATGVTKTVAAGYQYIVTGRLNILGTGRLVLNTGRLAVL